MDLNYASEKFSQAVNGLVLDHYSSERERGSKERWPEKLGIPVQFDATRRRFDRL
jgi:hypothetical protein